MQNECLRLYNNVGWFVGWCGYSLARFIHARFESAVAAAAQQGRGMKNERTDRRTVQVCTRRNNTHNRTDKRQQHDDDERDDADADANNKHPK